MVATMRIGYRTLGPETYNDALIAAPGDDVHYLEEQWRAFWVESGRPQLKNADATFIGFCKSRSCASTDEPDELRWLGVGFRLRRKST